MMKKTLIAALAVAALALAAFIAPPPQPAQAATSNVSVGGAPVMLIPLHFSGAYTTTTTAAKFNMPMPCQMIGVGATARAAPNNGVPTLDVQLGGVSILSAAIELSTGTYVEGTISTATITDEGVVTVTLGVPDGSVTDTTVLMTCVRK